MYRVFFLLAMAGALPVEADRLEGTLTGVVRNVQTESPVVGAKISLFGRETASDERGEFRFENVPIGVVELQVEAKGFAPKRVRNILISAGRVARIFVELRPEAPLTAELEGIRVEADSFEGNSRATTSVVRIDRFEMQGIVGAGWDVQRSFGVQPGVTTSSDLTNHLVVRGGNPSENLIRVEDVEVPNVSHIATQGETGGAISLVNLDFVRDAEFFTGGFPAAYGGKLSSVLDIRLREGNRERLGGELELSMAGAGGGLEGPFLDGKGSWIAAYRKSYLELLKRSARLIAVPRYEDLHFKATFDLSETQRLSWFFILGKSDVDIQWARNADRAVMDVQKLLTGFTWKGLWSSAASRVTLSHVLDLYRAQAWQGKPEPVYNNQSREGQSGVEATLDLGEDVQNSWSFGVNAHQSRFRYFILSDKWVGYSENEGRLIFLKEHSVNALRQAWRLGGYLHRNQSLGRPLEAKLGLRAQRFTLTGASSVDPRFGITWHIGEKAAFHLSGGRYHQSPTYVLLTLDPANASLDDLRAWHLVLGYERRLGRSTRFLAEAYAKDYDKIPIREQERLSADNVFKNLGRRRVRGVDLFLEKRLEEGVFGSVLLSLARSVARDAQGVWYPDDYDVPVRFLATGGMPLGSSGWRLSGRWDYKAGRPYTFLPIRPNGQGGYRLDPDFEVRNSVRYPPYHRLDLRVDRRLDFGGWGVSLFLEVENVYNRRNISAWNFDVPKGKLVGVEQFRRLIIVGILADF